MPGKLSQYVRKRDFALTKEPRGKTGRASGNRFVIQRHDATRLHFDLRLELDGVYKSWAVTKVPSLDPAVKRLAVEVEDHPLDYGTFEGTIPEGQYGGGTVQLWDRGTWASQSDTAPEHDFAKGHIKFKLDGERLRGGWALVRMKDRDQNGRPTKRHNWLLIKETDEAAQPGEPDSLLAADTSVKTGRTLEEIAGNEKGAVGTSKPTGKKAPVKPARARRTALRTLPGKATRKHSAKTRAKSRAR